jgi:glutamate racemase
VQQACQVFVALAEEGWTDSSVAIAAADRYLGPLFGAPSPPDTLVLGCTHFPVLAGPIRQIVGADAAIVDSAETTASAVVEALAGQGMANESHATRTGSTRFFATDSPERFARVGEIFLGRPIDSKTVELVDLRSAP